MCGVFGYFQKNLSSEANDISTFELSKSLLKLSETRGKDASGICTLTNEQITIFKTNLPAKKFIKNSNFKEILNAPIYGFMGHARMVTNGSSFEHNNNQPVYNSSVTCIHNGIIVNDEDLYKSNSEIKRDYQVDTEVIVDLIDHLLQKRFNPINAIQKTFSQIKGAASVLIGFRDYAGIAAYTNNGSLYYIHCNDENKLLLASERFILEKIQESFKVFKKNEIFQVEPNNGLFYDPSNGNLVKFKAQSSLDEKDYVYNKKYREIVDQKSKDMQIASSSNLNLNVDPKLLIFPENYLLGVKRCSKCLLPETFPFIQFDAQGICHYCNNFRPIQWNGYASLEKDIQAKLNTSGSKKIKPIVALSGGRDSCYVLHYLKKEMGLNPIAYTYDWGMVTDLARRNISRMSEQLGVEHILVSADITQKRLNVRKNVTAWLKKPDLGIIPLFMAGDKQFFYYSDVVKKQNQATHIFFGQNPLEKTDFKTGFCGINISPKKEGLYYRLGYKDQLQMISFYGGQFLQNPSYINSSIADTLFAYMSYYMIPHDYVFFFNHIKWHEEHLVSTLIKTYDWEVAHDTTTTWRIGDGTASFYNYIYLNMAGFTESDTFRSNQIREGLITRQQGFEMLIEESRPRFESIKWYCETIGLDFNDTIKRINQFSRFK